MNDAVDVSTRPTVERVRVAVLRLKGMVGEASMLASQLASARRRQLLCVDRRRRRQLPRLPAVDRPDATDEHLDRFPVQPSNTDSETASDFTSSTTNESSSLESCPAFGGDFTQNSPTSRVCDLMTVTRPCNPVDLPRFQVPEDRRRRTGDVQQSRLDGIRQTTLIETPSGLVVENDQRSGRTPDYEVVVNTTVTHNQVSRHTLSYGSRFLQTVYYLVHVAAETTPIRCFTDSVQRMCCIISGLNRNKNRPTTSQRSRTTSHIVAVVLTAAIFVCVAVISYYEESNEPSSEPTNGRIKRSWLAAPWNKFGLQFRHTAPPPV